MSYYIDRQVPRISLNKLGEYVAGRTSVFRRRQIIKDQKKAPTFAMIRYTPAERVILDYLSDGLGDEFLVRMMGEMYQKSEEAETDFEAKQFRLCIEALRKFRLIAPGIDLGDATIERGPQKGSLHLGGMEVSVRPEALLVLPPFRKIKKAGLVKLYFSKTHPLDDHAAAVMGAVLMKYGEEQLDHRGKFDHRQVLVMDVFAEKVYSAPRATVAYLKEAEANCEEIAFQWDRFEAV